MTQKAMTSAERLKERLAKDQVVNETSFEALAAARKNDIDDHREELQEQMDQKAAAVLKAEVLEGEVNSLTMQLNSMTAQRNRWAKETKAMRVKLAMLEEAAREVCDVTELDGEGAELRQLRHHVWNDEDTEALRQAEGIDE